MLEFRKRGVRLSILRTAVKIEPTILLVEDDSNDALLMRLALERTHPEVRLSVASNGLEALKYLEGQQPYADRSVFPLPQLILLDLVMPLFTGLQVLRWIRDRPEFDSLPVVMLTSFPGNEDADLACEMGADSYIVKPLSFDRLEDALDRAVDRLIGGRRLVEQDWLAWSERKAA